MSCHLNIGKILERPFESKYSIFCRFLIANAGIRSRETICQLLPPLETKGRMKNIVDRVVDLNYGNNMRPKHLKYFDEIYLAKYDIYRNCPKCADESYHTDLFNLPWLSLCPIHLVKLESICPLCQQNWPSYENLISRRCFCCGPALNRNAIDKLDYAIVDTDRYRSLAMLFDFIQYGHNEELYLTSSEAINYFYDFRSYSDNSIMAINFPSVQVKRHPRINKQDLINIGIKLRPAKYKKYKLYKLSEVEKKKREQIKWEDIQQWSSLERYKALKTVYRHLNKIASKNHHLQVYNYSMFSYCCRKYEESLCFYCTVYSVWFYFITDLPSNRIRQNTCRKYSFDNGFIYNFKTPSPLFFFKDKSHYFTELRLQRWFYQHDLLCSFVKIFRYIYSSVVDSYSTLGRNFRTSKTSFGSLNGIYTESSLLFYKHELNDEMILVHTGGSVLNELEIPRIKNTVEKCRKFKKYMKNEWGFFPIERILKYGLSYEQHVLLEHGSYLYGLPWITETRFLNSGR